MPRRREPSVVEIDECGLLVKHTHDVELATKLAREWVERSEDYGDLPGPARCVWVRIITALPSSWAAGEGYAWRIEPGEPGERGVFRAVQFYRPL
jgi:hypothetical protein